MSEVITEITSPIFDVQVGNGITGTPVVDNLTSTSTTSALSANQGRILNVAVTANTTDVSKLKSDLSTEVTRAKTVEATKADQTSLNATNAKLQNVIDMTKGVVWKEITDASLAQTKTVATDSSTSATYSSVASYADMTMLGGMSRKGYNLISPTLATTEQNDVTCINNGDGTYTLSGTASNYTIFTLFHYSDLSEVLKTGNTYKCVGCPSSAGGNAILVDTYGNVIRDEGSGSVFTFTENVELSIFINSGYTCSNLVFKPMITTDTSLTYDDYEPYSDHLLDAAVDEVDWLGTKPHILNDISYNWLKENVDQWHISNSIVCVDSYKDFAWLYSDDNYANVYVCYLSGTQITKDKTNNSAWINNAKYGYNTVVYANNPYRSSVDSTSTIGIPTRSIEIPSTITDLCPDYGIGVNSSCYNYIDFENKVYHHKVGSVDLGTLSYSRFLITGSSNYGYQAQINGCNIGVLNQNPNIIAVDFSVVAAGSNSSCIDSADKIISEFAGYDYICLRYDSITTADALQTALSGKYLYYELATEETIDLSDVLDDDLEFLKVEGGGTVSFHYPEYDNGYVIDMPSSITYDVNITE